MSRARAESDRVGSERTDPTRPEPGLKLVQAWTLDPAAPGFADEVRRQIERLRHAPEEAEALAFIEAAAQWPEP